MFGNIILHDISLVEHKSTAGCLIHVFSQRNFYFCFNVFHDVAKNICCYVRLVPSFVFDVMYRMIKKIQNFAFCTTNEKVWFKKVKLSKTNKKIHGFKNFHLKILQNIKFTQIYLFLNHKWYQAVKILAFVKNVIIFTFLWCAARN